MIRLFNSFANVFTVCVHFMLCTALVFVCAFGQTPFAAQPATAGHTAAQGTVVTAAIAATAATIASAASDTSDAPAFEINSDSIEDLAGDLPELMLATGAPGMSTATVYRQVAFKLRALPHPFAEQPQRPPQIASTRV